MKSLFFLLLLPGVLYSCRSGSPASTDTSRPDTVNKATEALPPETREERGKAQGQAVNPYKDAKVEVLPFRDSLGWGYDIKINGTAYVHQPHIPAVPGIRGFSSREKAQRAGELVAFKIKNNIMPPSVSDRELDSLDVLR